MVIKTKHDRRDIIELDHALKTTGLIAIMKTINLVKSTNMFVTPLDSKKLITIISFITACDKTCLSACYMQYSIADWS